VVEQIDGGKLVGLKEGLERRRRRNQGKELGSKVKRGAIAQSNRGEGDGLGEESEQERKSRKYSSNRKNLRVGRVGSRRGRCPDWVGANSLGIKLWGKSGEGAYGLRGEFGITWQGGGVGHY